MIQIRRYRGVGAAVAAAALAMPAAASAHPSVYVASAPTACTAPGAAGTYSAVQFLATCTTQTRYVFTNHGNTYLLRETNGRTSGGAISYAHRPGGPAVTPPAPASPGLKDASDFDIFALPPQGPATGAQPHATCDVAALDTPAVIRGWQGTDPFYAYVPFQRNAVGVDDQAANWLGIVQTATGVNLDAVADTDAGRQAACQGLGGTYYPADATQSSLASWSSGQVHLATAPLEEEIAGMASRIGSLDAVGANSRLQIDALTSEIAALKRALRSLQLSLPPAIPGPGALASDGIALTLAGPANRTVNVRMRISAARAKRLGLRSRIIGRQSVVLDGGGSAAFTLKPTSGAAAGLRKAKGALELALEAATGDRHNLVSAKLGA